MSLEYVNAQIQDVNKLAASVRASIERLGLDHPQYSELSAQLALIEAVLRDLENQAQSLQSPS